MKRTIAILLVALMVLCFAACGGKPAEGAADATGKPAENQQGGEGSGEAPGGNDSPANQSPVALDGSRIGVLQPVKEGRVRIKGLLLTTDSGHHDYPSIEELSEGGFKTEGLYAEYFTSEWFAVYADVEGGASTGVFILPNDPNRDVTKLTAAELAAASESLPYPVYAGECSPDPENNGLLFAAYVHNELGAGLYDVFFTDGDEIVYVLQLNITPEP